MKNYKLFLMSMGIMVLTYQCSAQKNLEAVAKDNPSVLPTRPNNSTPTTTTPTTATTALKLDSTVLAKVGAPMANCLETPDSVSAYLLHEFQYDTTRQGFKDFKVDSFVARLSKEQIITLITIVSNQKNYIWGPPAKKCEFFPRVAFVFHKKQEVAYIMIATYCDILQMSNAADKILLKEDCDPVHSQIIQLAKSIFPHKTIGRE